MEKLIPVVDLTSGALLEREKDTLTLDVPRDLDGATPDVFVEADRLAHYHTAAGTDRVYVAKPRRLSHRSAGEECLVAAQDVDSSGPAAVRRYTRAVVEPRPRR